MQAANVKIIVYTLILYAFFLLIGGVFGYVKTQSLVSLMMGSVSGLVIIGASLAMNRGFIAGFWISCLVTTALFSLFSYRYLLTQKIWPPGILAFVSLAMLVLLIIMKKIDSNECPS